MIENGNSIIPLLVARSIRMKKIGIGLDKINCFTKRPCVKIKKYAHSLASMFNL